MQKQNLVLWLLCLLSGSMLLMLPPEQAAHGDSNSTDLSGWSLAPLYLTPLDTPARFEPSNRKPPQEQAFWTFVALQGSGVLHMPSQRATVQRRRDKATLTLSARSALLLADGTFALLPDDQNGIYKHRSSTPSTLRLLLPPLLIGSEATQLRYETLADGWIWLDVVEGPVTVRPLLLPAAPTTLQTGESLLFQPEVKGDELLPLSGQEREAARTLFENQKRNATRSVDATSTSELKEAIDRISRGAKGENDTSAILYPKLFGVQADSPSLELLEVTRQFAIHLPDEHLTPRALYQGWLSSQSLDAGLKGLPLARALQLQYAESAWAKLQISTSSVLKLQGESRSF